MHGEKIHGSRCTSTRTNRYPRINLTRITEKSAHVHQNDADRHRAKHRGRGSGGGGGHTHFEVVCAGKGEACNAPGQKFSKVSALVYSLLSNSSGEHV
jgi:hypothetical protein